MPYRICTFDGLGRLIDVSELSYRDNTMTYDNSVFLSTPAAKAFIDERYINTSQRSVRSAADSAFSCGDIITLPDGSVAYTNPPSKNKIYDPRYEAILAIPDPGRLIRRGSYIYQDITTTKTIGSSDPNLSSLTPYSSGSVRKFGPTSAKFTRSNLGFTSGFITVGNISKDSIGGYTTPHNNICAGLTWSFAVEAFFYPQNSSNNFVLFQKGPVGQYANWKIGFDSSAGFLQFAWQYYGLTSGYNATQNIVATAGITLNQWHHVAVAMVRNGNTAGHYLLSGYFNGVNVFSQSLTAGSVPEVRYDNPIYIGNNTDGTEAFDGFLDSIRVLHSGTTGGLFGPSGYGYLPYGSGTLGVPTLEGFTRNSQVAFSMNFNGEEPSSIFYAESTEYFTAEVLAKAEEGFGESGPVFPGSVDVGIYDILRYGKDFVGATGYSDATGFSTGYGPIVIPYIKPIENTGSPLYYAHGFDFSFNLNYIFDSQVGTADFRIHQKNDLLYESSIEKMYLIEGAAGNRGSSGSVRETYLGQNPFARLFSQGDCYGVCGDNTSLFIQPNSYAYRYVMEQGLYVTQGITPSSYCEFVDALGYTRKITPTEISRLRLDLIDHEARIKKALDETAVALNTANTNNEMKIVRTNKPTKVKTYSPVIGAEEGFGTDKI